MAKYLVTGGAGFIGSHLCAALVMSGHRVRVLDDLSTGRTANLLGGVDVMQGSVTDPDRVRRALVGVDGCFHLAAVASVERSTKDWAATHEVNQTGLINVLEAVRHRPVPVVYASSAAVYGASKRSLLDEFVRTSPTSPYGADKAACELHASVASRAFGVPTIGLRFFNVYGPRQDPHSPYSGVVSIFCKKLLAGDPVTVFGDGSQVRDFVYVGDVVGALMCAMSLGAPPAEVLNVCTGKGTSVLELLFCIASELRVKPRIRFRPARQGDIARSVGWNTRTRAALDWMPETPLSVGLKRVLDWMRTQ